MLDYTQGRGIREKTSDILQQPKPSYNLVVLHDLFPSLIKDPCVLVYNALNFRYKLLHLAKFVCIKLLNSHYNLFPCRTQTVGVRLQIKFTSARSRKMQKADKNCGFSDKSPFIDLSRPCRVQAMVLPIKGPNHLSY